MEHDLIRWVRNVKIPRKRKIRVLLHVVFDLISIDFDTPTPHREELQKIIHDFIVYKKSNSVNELAEILGKERISLSPQYAFIASAQETILDAIIKMYENYEDHAEMLCLGIIDLLKRVRSDEDTMTFLYQYVLFIHRTLPR